MPLKHLVVHVGSSGRTEERLELAAALCLEHGAHLTGLFAEGVSLGSSIVGRRSLDHVHAAMKHAEAAFRAKASAAGLKSTWWQLEPAEDVGRLAGAVAICCRYADLAILGQHDSETDRLPEDAVESVLLESGRPVLLIPMAGHYPMVGKRVVVAWTGSRESARAVNDALPLMSDAEFVTLLAFQQRSGGASNPFPNLDIIAHLEAHGIQARYERVVVAEDDELGVVDTILNRAADVTADLIVVGARPGHGFGTRVGSHARGLLRSMTTPVLLSA